MELTMGFVRAAGYAALLAAPSVALAGITCCRWASTC